MKKLTFAELLNLKWEYNNQNDGEDLHLQAFEEGKDIYTGVIVDFVQTWGDFEPISHSLDNDDIARLSNLFLNAGEMYKLIKKLDTEEAKELIKKIESTEIVLHKSE